MKPRARLVTAAACVWLAIGHAAEAVAAFDAGRAPFTVRINDDLEIPYRVFAVYVLPGETLRIEAAPATADFTLDARGGEVRSAATPAWVWAAPAEPGLAELTIAGPAGEIRINALVMHPARRVRDGALHGYRIGEYPAPLNGNRVYRSPDGFIALDEHNGDVQLSPHFRLSQFPSKQSPDFPKYLVLREQLLLKLELLLEHVNTRGIAADTLTVMSGFRTPFYNAVIGNGRHSRHVYGGAADVYVDVAPKDERMDDLNGDGAHDYRDAQWLYRRAVELFATGSHRSLRGGLGVYRSTAAHGPFLHIDARGVRARWGLIP